MNKIKYSFLLLTTLTMTLWSHLGSAQEKGTRFENITLEEALAKATKKEKAGGKSPKLIFVDCYTSWCGPCKKMASQVFPLSIMGDFFNANFINLKIDTEKGEGVEIAKKYNITAYPTFLILKANGEEINRVVGAAGAEEFIKRITFAMNPDNSTANFKAKYLANPNFETAMTYLRAMDSGNFNYGSDIREMYYQFTDRERFNKEFFDLLINSIQSPIDPLLDDVIINKWRANNWLGQNHVDNKLKEIYSGYLGRIMMGLTLDTATVEETIEAAKATTYFCSNPQMAESHFGAIAFFVVKKDVEGFLDYITKSLTEVPASEQINLLEPFMFIEKNATKEQKEKFKEYLSGIEKEVLEDANSMKRAVGDYQRLVMNK